MATTDQFAERLFNAALGTVDLFTAYIGDRLGFYRALAASPHSAKSLAEATGTDARYAREWLEQQAVSDLITVEDAEASADDRRYSLSTDHAAVLAEPENLAAMAWIARIFAGIGGRLPALVDAYRTGGGVGWEEYGDDVIEAQGDQNRPVFAHLLGKEWFPSLPDVDAALRAGGSLADVACGVGFSAIAIAKAYPNARVTGFDLDGPSIERARDHARAAGVDDRVTFEVTDIATVTGGSFDVVAMFEALHDLPKPVDALRAMRAMAGDGPVIVMDERVADRFTAPGDEVERLMYGYSTLLCLPSSKVERDSAALGTVLRQSTLNSLAIEAGFSAVEVLPIEHDFFRLYLLK